MLLFSYLLMSGITTGALYGLVALGFVVVNKATGVINFAQGEFFMFTGFVAWMLHVQQRRIARSAPGILHRNHGDALGPLLLGKQHLRLTLDGGSQCRRVNVRCGRHGDAVMHGGENQGRDFRGLDRLAGGKGGVAAAAADQANT